MSQTKKHAQLFWFLLKKTPRLPATKQITRSLESISNHDGKPVVSTAEKHHQSATCTNLQDTWSRTSQWHNMASPQGWEPHAGGDNHTAVGKKKIQAGSVLVFLLWKIHSLLPFESDFTKQINAVVPVFCPDQKGNPNEIVVQTCKSKEFKSIQKGHNKAIWNQVIAFWFPSRN